MAVSGLECCEPIRHSPRGQGGYDSRHTRLRFIPRGAQQSTYISTSRLQWYVSVDYRGLHPDTNVPAQMLVEASLYLSLFRRRVSWDCREQVLLVHSIKLRSHCQHRETPLDQCRQHLVHDNISPSLGKSHRSRKAVSDPPRQCCWILQVDLHPS
jgi:hypothetical protein